MSGAVLRDGHSAAVASVWDKAKPIYVALLLAILTWIALQALGRLTHVLLILFVSILFAAALTGPVRLLERRRVPRAISVILIYLVSLLLVVGLLWFVTPPLFDQVASLGDRAPEYAERYDRLQEAYEEIRANYGSLPPFDVQVERLGNAILERAGQRALELPGALFALFLDALSVFVISLLLVTNRERILGFTLTLVHPDDRKFVGGLLEKMWTRVGAYLRAKLIVMTIVGALTYVALLVIGVPFALVLAIIVALGETIPRAGPWLARIPLLGIAALEGLATFGLVFAASVVIENGKGYFISPYVEGDQLDIHPLLVFVAVLVGATLGGFAGAFVAVPLAAIVDLFVARSSSRGGSERSRSRPTADGSTIERQVVAPSTRTGVPMSAPASQRAAQISPPTRTWPSGRQAVITTPRTPDQRLGADLNVAALAVPEPEQDLPDLEDERPDDDENVPRPVEDEEGEQERDDERHGLVVTACPARAQWPRRVVARKDAGSVRTSNVRARLRTWRAAALRAPVGARWAGGGHWALLGGGCGGRA